MQSCAAVFLINQCAQWFTAVVGQHGATSKLVVVLFLGIKTQ